MLSPRMVITNAQGPEGMRTFAHRDFAREGVEGFLQRAFMPNVKHIPPRRNMRNRHGSAAIRNPPVRRRHHNDDGAHLGMNIAEDVADAGPIECDGAAASRFVRPKSKRLPSHREKTL